MDGSNAQIKLTRNAELVSPGLSLFADDDPTLNVAIVAGPNSKGITTASISANTTSGYLESVPQVETATASGTITANGSVQAVVTADGLPGSPKTYVVSVLAGDTASDWAAKVRAALSADVDVTDRFVVGGSGSSITLTRKEFSPGTGIYALNDPTLNISL